MRFYERLLLAALREVVRRLDPLRQRLQERRDAEAEDALRAACGGHRDGAWVEVVAVTCEKCAADWKPGDVARVRRFTTEGQVAGEWVFDKPRTAFVCAAGIKLKRHYFPQDAAVAQ